MVSHESQPPGRSVTPCATISGRAASRSGAATGVAVSAVVTVRLILSLRSALAACPSLESEQGLRFLDVGRLLGQPFLVLVGRHRDHPSDHVRVPLAAELGALAVVRAR